MPELVGGFVLAFLLAALPGKWAVGMLRKLGAKQNVSEDAPAAHAAKQGTPTMGGLLVLSAFTVAFLIMFFVTPSGRQRLDAQDYAPLALLLMTLAYGVIGFIDDFLSARRGKNLGFRAREKFAAQVLVAVGFMLYLAKTAQPGTTTLIQFAPEKLALSWIADLSFWYYVLMGVYLVALSNATNITDGLDGLSSGVVLAICLALAVLLSVMYPALSLFCITLAGALAGFLWWNAHPAKMFMGDTGSLALGAGLGGAAMLGKQEAGLFIASLVCWAELLCVVIQVGVFKYRKKRYGLDYAKSHRVFKRAPLHHHFEELGWNETTVVTRFWIAGAICAALALLWGR
jgi:phospho-N-acetylmuramoyl-pentapeptide-transferase